MEPMVNNEELALEPVSDTELRRAVIIQTVVDALSLGNTIAKACQKAGICEQTWRNWRREGYVGDLINMRFKDVTAGIKTIVADSLVASTKVLALLAQGQIPPDTAINGTLAPRDVVSAQQQLINLWEKLGGDQETKEREQERLLEELAAAHISITTVHVTTVNMGDETQPIPVPVGFDAIDGEYTELGEDL